MLSPIKNSLLHNEKTALTSDNNNEAEKPLIQQQEH